MRIFKEFRFESAHRLPHVPAGHKCGRIHGHSYRLVVAVEGPVEPGTGWVRDFADVATAVKPLVGTLDHHLLNDIDGLDNPTSEMVAQWLWDRLKGELYGLSEITVWETETSGCSHRGD
jgi:6-pyruvoyltetrahydropterin/6-carboxytetrahydropterin synthase